MKRFTKLGMCLAAISVFSIIPSEILASALDNTEELVKEANSIKTFLFGTPVKLAGSIGGAYGLVMAFVTSSARPLILYGGIGLCANMMPKFIDMIFSTQ